MGEVVYFTKDPVTVQAYLDACAQRQQQIQKIVNDIRALGADPDDIRGTGDGISKPSITSLTPLWLEDVQLDTEDDDEPVGTATLQQYVIPDGWRIVSGRLEPRRGKPGVSARGWLAEHQPVDVRGIMQQHGLPRACWVGDDRTGGYRIKPPAVIEHDGTVWAHYVAEPGVSDCGFDKTPCTWERGKMSEFYAAQEAFDAAQAEQAEVDW